MKNSLGIYLAVVASVVIFSFAAVAQTTEEDRSWNQPVEPFRIAGNIYYVGASDITSYLITSPKGHILIDGGFVETVPQIKANVAKLGFKLGDVKYLLSSHAHYDHAGGLAELKRLTGAKFLVSEADAELMANGGKGDPNFGNRFPFEGVRADETFGDGSKVSIGGVTLTARITPGHTRGCTTWTTETREKGRKLSVVFVCSTSAPGYRLVNNAKYTSIYEDYQRTFALLHALKPDIFLGSHGQMYDLTEKMKRLRDGAKENPFIDPAGYREYLRASRARLETAYTTQRNAN